jgi:hypothetical protein
MRNGSRSAWSWESAIHRLLHLRALALVSPGPLEIDIEIDSHQDFLPEEYE